MQHESSWWDDGTQTSEGIGGVSAIGINEAPYLRNSPVGYDGNVVLILGSNAHDQGWDDGEIVMHNPIVLEILQH